MNPNIEIYPHNKRAYENVCAAFESSNKTCVIQPTGTGKMYVAMQLMDEHPNAKTLYLTSYSPIISALDREMDKCGVFKENLFTAMYAGLDEATCSKKYDYIIMDEFHRAGAEVWGSRVNQLLENNPEAKVLGLSATPIRYLDNNRDMSDELFDGNVASQMSLAEAVGTGILKMPTYVNALYSLDAEIERYQQRINRIRNSANRLDAQALLDKAKRSLDHADGLPEIFAERMTVKDGRYIVFCRNYEHMEQMQKGCQAWFKDVNSKIKFYELRNTRTDAVNEQTLVNFNGDTSEKLKLLFVVDMLNEGVHLKNVDGAIMLRPTESMNVFLQQLGRAISVGSQGKTTVFDIVNNATQLNAFGKFKSDVERIARENNFTVELGDFEVHEYLRDFREIAGKIDSLVAPKSWEDWFELAQQFKQENGHSFIPGKYLTAAGESLGSWWHKQKESYKDGELPQERQEKLETIGMVWDLNDAAWKHNLSLAREYFLQNGDLNVPVSFVTQSGEALGVWISNQRSDFKNGKLTDDQISSLEDIGMDWYPLETVWNKMFDLLGQYHRQFGHLNVSSRYVTEDGKNLGLWFYSQKKLFQKGKLEPQRQKKLESLGIVWDVFDQAWENNIVRAEQYLKQYGNFEIPVKFVTEDGVKLGEWIAHQRKNLKRNKLTQEQIMRLDSLGMVWDGTELRLRGLEAEWQRKFKLAEDFLKGNGHLKIPSSYVAPSGDQIGQWLEDQRKFLKKGLLSEERKKQLDSIGMVWDGWDIKKERHNEAWNANFALAKAFFQENKHLDVPYIYRCADGSKLGDWIHTQRKQFKQGRLTPERVQKLDSIGMVWVKKERGCSKKPVEVSIESSLATAHQSGGTGNLLDLIAAAEGQRKEWTGLGEHGGLGEPGGR